MKELEERIRELEEENKRLKSFIWELADENGEIILMTGKKYKGGDL